MSALMSSMKLAAFPIAALVLFLMAFGIVVWRVFGAKQAAEMDRASRIPIEDGVVTERTGGGEQVRRAC
jgi:cbb3-type cytochrome oxidase subunit 3